MELLHLYISSGHNFRGHHGGPAGEMAIAIGPETDVVVATRVPVPRIEHIATAGSGMAGCLTAAIGTAGDQYCRVPTGAAGLVGAGAVGPDVVCEVAG